MLKRKLLSLATVTLFVAFGCLAPAQGQDRRNFRDTSDISRRVEKELVTLPYYGIFDNLEYSVNGGTVTLLGQVVRPTTKSDAESRVRHIAGVTQVVDRIQVLPLSPFDDDIRRAEYRAIFSEPQLQKYAMGANPSIHIIVSNGHVSLEGVVSNMADRDLANIRANQVPNVFSVTNHLRVQRSS